MSLGQHMTVVRVQCVDRRRAGKRGARAARATPVEQQPCFTFDAFHLATDEPIDERRPGKARPTGGNADQVEQTTRRLPYDIGRQVGEGQRAHVCWYVDGDVRRGTGSDIPFESGERHAGTSTAYVATSSRFSTLPLGFVGRLSTK